jgi:hypothetical protein
MQSKSFKRSAVALAIAGAFAVGVTTADRVSMHARRPRRALPRAPPRGCADPVPAVPASLVAAALPDFSGRSTPTVPPW